MRELEVLTAARQDVSDGLSAELAALRFECFQLRFALGCLCEAVEGWGQWTMSRELADAHQQATTALTSRAKPRVD